MDNLELYLYNTILYEHKLHSNPLAKDEEYKLLMLQSFLLNIEEKESFIEIIRENNDIIIELLDIQ